MKCLRFALLIASAAILGAEEKPSDQSESQVITVHVLGEVLQPGEIKHSVPFRVDEAIAAAGGVATFGEKNSVSVTRSSEAGEPKRTHFDLSGAEAFPNEPPFLLEDGDIVFVPLTCSGP